MAEENTRGPHGFGAPDPSLATKEEIAQVRGLLEELCRRNREESKGWIDTLQRLLEEKISRNTDRSANTDVLITETRRLLEEKIEGAEDKTANLDRVVQTRLAGSETALNAAMAASDKVVAKIETGVGSIMNEMKANFSKQIDALNDKIEDLKKRVFESGGHTQGTHQMVMMAIAGAAMLAAVVAVIISLSRGAVP